MMGNFVKWDHDQLALDLKSHLMGNRGARMVWCDMQLGPSGSPRPDVYVMSKSYSKFTPTSYEVKVSRADFQSDINSAKWQKYFKFSSAVTFAVPDGLIKRIELPEGAGLIVRKDKVWRTVKAPKINHLTTLPHAVWMKLFIDGLDNLRTTPKSVVDHILKDRVAREVLGEDIASSLRDLDTARVRIDLEKQNVERRFTQIEAGNAEAIERAQKRNEIASDELDALCDILGVRRKSNIYAVQNAIRNLKDELDRDVEIARLLTVTKNAELSLRQIHETISSKISKKSADTQPVSTSLIGRDR